MTQETQELPKPGSDPIEEKHSSENTSVLSVVEDKRNAGGSVKESLVSLAAKLPLQLDLCVPVPSFHVQNLMSLEKGQVVETNWPHTEDLPLWSGGVQLVWSEFEVVDQKLGVRVTRLA